MLKNQTVHPRKQSETTPSERPRKAFQNSSEEKEGLIWQHLKWLLVYNKGSGVRRLVVVSLGESTVDMNGYEAAEIVFRKV